MVTSTVVDELNTLTKPIEDKMVANRGDNHDHNDDGRSDTTGVLNVIHHHVCTDDI